MTGAILDASIFENCCQRETYPNQLWSIELLPDEMGQLGCFFLPSIFRQVSDGCEELNLMTLQIDVYQGKW